MADNQNINHELAPPGAFNAKPSEKEVAGCLSKGDVFRLLRPHSSRYDSRTVSKFFTDEILEQCGISREELKRIRVFPVNIHAVVINHLRKNYLL